MNILAVGAHWDDIELGCGLTLKKLNKKGHKIFSAVICSSQYGPNENEGMKESEALKSGLKSFSSICATYVPTEKEPNSKLSYNKKSMQILEKKLTLFLLIGLEILIQIIRQHGIFLEQPLET